MGEDGADRDALRARVAEGHAAVADGRYDRAIRLFEGALPGLAAALGDDHPEVQELRDDLEAVRQMRDVGQWGAEMGFRGFRRSSEPDET